MFGSTNQNNVICKNAVSRVTFISSAIISDFVREKARELDMLST